jgi:isoleucyl-tRNA synthetase
VRQPLARALVGLPPGVTLTQDLLDDVGDELNVKDLQPLDAASEVVDVQVKANFRELGKRFGKRTQQVATAITAADPRSVVASLRDTESFTVSLDGEDLNLGAGDVQVTEVPRTGWVVESQRGVTIALDTEVTPVLAAEGIARDVVRVVQQARREADLDVADRIALSIGAATEVQQAIRAHEHFVTHETLATSLTLSDTLPTGFTGTVGHGEEVAVAVTKA